MNIYLTGDNTRQPKARLVQSILERYLGHTRSTGDSARRGPDGAKPRAGHRLHHGGQSQPSTRRRPALTWLQCKLETTGQGILAARISAMAGKH
jgi:hypothetical protein